jgi:hypothetical protein
MDKHYSQGGRDTQLVPELETSNCYHYCYCYFHYHYCYYYYYVGMRLSFKVLGPQRHLMFNLPIWTHRFDAMLASDARGTAGDEGLFT